MLIRSQSIGAIIFTSLAVGCGMQPIPEVAVEGTTVIIPIPGYFEVGYGIRSVSNAISLSASAGPTITGSQLQLSSSFRAQEDFQRGELLLTLMEDVGGGLAEVANLKTRYVAAVAADPGSERGRTEYPDRKRQNAAVVEIPFMRDVATTTCPAGPPCSLVPDSSPPRQFYIRVQRIRRTQFTSGSTSYARIKQSFFDSSENPPNTIDSDWLGWGGETASGDDPTKLIPITIMDSSVSESIESDPNNANYPRTFTGMEYWYAINMPGNYNPPIFYDPIANVMRSNITSIQGAQPRPDPEFQVSVARPYGSLVAAWKLTVQYPAHRITITDVRPNRTRGAGSWLHYTVSPAVAPGCSGPTMGSLTVNMADPDVVTTGVIVSYRLRTDMTGSCTSNPVLPSEFGPTISVVAYDVNGALVSDATATGPSGPDFQDL